MALSQTLQSKESKVCANTMKNQYQLFDTIGEAKVTYQTTSRPFRKVHSAKCIYEFLKEIWDPGTLELYESFVVLILNRANQIISYRFMSHGGISGTVVDAKLIFQFGLLSNGSAMIVAHNHPSGNLRPSENDDTLTVRLRQVGDTLDFPVLDHVIIGGQGGFYSYGEEGRL